MQKTKKSSLFLAVLFGLLIAVFSSSVFPAFAKQSPEKNVEVTEAQIIWYDSDDEDEEEKSNNVATDEEEHQQQEEEEEKVFALDIFVENDGKTESYVITTEQIEDLQESMREIREDYEDKVINQNADFSIYLPQDQIDEEKIITIYNNEYRQDKEQYTEKDFALTLVVDVQVNDNILEKLEENSKNCVKVVLDEGQSANKNDPLPIILYKCDDDSSEWKHFVYSHEKGETKNWAERNDEGKIVLYFYEFCPLMIYEPVIPSEEGGCQFPWCLLVLILCVILLILIIILIKRKSDDDEEEVKKIEENEDIQNTQQD